MPSLPARRAFVGTPELWRANVDFFAGLIERDLAAPIWRPTTLANLVENAFGNAARRTLLDLADPAIAGDLRTVACASAALFSIASLPPGTELQALHPSGSTTTATSTGLDPQSADPIHWRRGVLAALAVRQRAALEILAAVSPDTLRALWPGAPQWVIAENAALAAVAMRSPSAGAALIAAAEAADSSTVSRHERRWLLDIVTPELQLAIAAIAHDQPNFDDWMARAIRCHHHYFGAATEKKNVHGQLALAPLAMACLARDLGLEVDVESDYVPRALLTAGP